MDFRKGENIYSERGKNEEVGYSLKLFAFPFSGSLTFFPTSGETGL